ncbi:hypothetical protein MATL_G00104960 [Megalops atlanticus]|uniref:protein-tyrosine-phosphatase n=1 Tax=Megalops atlanticus TaxID=7932 RepID=A0A9D3T5G7_MEGAT|nr:hypothetical protein MATL_G00104960 [Megalops atlanticus]
MDQQVQALRGFLARLSSKEAETEDAEGGFAGEFARLKRQSTKYRTEKIFPSKAAEKQGNVKKNRYKDIVPFDHTRVKLSLSTSDSDTDYINANFIKGVFKQRAYIATQGPLPHTVLDFWRMIWEYKVEIIVMVCREFEMGRKKCERYWPERKEEPFVCNPFTVQCESVESRGDYLTRVLKVTFRNSSRILKQLHYVNWPDHGVPDSIPPILELIQEMRSYQEHDDIPICIHCSAGCGRTGALCVIDYTWKMMRNQMITENFSIFELVQDMRTQRPSVVQTKEQYELVYRTIKFLFETYLRTIANQSSAVEEPAAPSFSPASSESDLTTSCCEVSDLEPEEELQSEEQPRHMKVEWLTEQPNHAVAGAVSSVFPHPAMEENSGWSPMSQVSLRSNEDILNSLMEGAGQWGPQEEDTQLKKQGGPDLHRAWTAEPVPDSSPNPTLNQGDTPTQKSSIVAWNGPQEEDEPLLEPDMHPDSTACRDPFCFSVEDPYFSPQSPIISQTPADSLDELRSWTTNPCFNSPVLALNDQPVTLSQLGTQGPVPSSSDEDSPPPLPERTPESYILATSPEISDVKEKLAVTVPPVTPETLAGNSSPPSPVPPLPERTPESFILATNEADLVRSVVQDTPLADRAKIGTSSEWCGSSEPPPLEPKKPWTRSKSLRVRMSLLVSPLTSLIPVPADSEPTAPPHPPDPLPPPAKTEPTGSLTPPLPERTPESFVLVTDEAPRPHDGVPGTQPSQQQSQRVGTSLEWAGNTQPRSFLDVMMNRSKSVRAKSSKQDRLSVALPSNMAPAPGGDAATPAPVEVLVDGGTPAATGSSEERPQNSSGRNSQQSMARTKSLKFLKYIRKSKGEPPLAPTPTGPPPPYATTPGFKISFGNRFGKPKGPRRHPETWV